MNVYTDLEQVIASNSVNAVFIASGMLLVFTVLALTARKAPEVLKKIHFISICTIVVLTTFYLASVTVWLNVQSSSKGPVHWHADYAVWDCGKELTLVDPTGLSNKIGTPTLHEHNDKRIHLEGVVVTPQDASLGKFFDVIGGSISADMVTFPTNEGLKTLQNGKCDGQDAELQVFAYHVKDGQYYQEKVAKPERFTIDPQSQVPPGNCIIIELGTPKNQTERICEQYQVAEKLGKIKKGSQ